MNPSAHFTFPITLTGGVIPNSSWTLIIIFHSILGNVKIGDVGEESPRPVDSYWKEGPCVVMNHSRPGRKLARRAPTLSPVVRSDTPPTEGVGSESGTNPLASSCCVVAFFILAFWQRAAEPL